MRTRALFIGYEELESIKRLRERATNNIIDAATAMQDPEAARARNSAQTIYLPNGFSVTYTVERQPMGLCRHLSVSVDTPDAGPNPHAVDMILDAFGMKPLMDSLSVWKEDYTPTMFAVNVLQTLSGEEGHA